MAELQAALDANTAFYRALADGDYAAMDLLWARTVPVACIHPGWPVIRGRDPVMESWRAIMRNPPTIARESAAGHLLGPLAAITCVERIGSAPLAATNLFVIEDGAWRMIHHHAGQAFDADNAGSTDESSPASSTDGSGLVH